MKHILSVPGKRSQLLIIWLVGWTPLIVLLSWAASSGWLYQSSCSPLAILTAAFHRSDGVAACKSLPFLTDIPSLLLGVSSSLSNVTYMLFLMKQRVLVEELRASGVLIQERYTFEHDRDLLALVEKPLSANEKIRWWVAISIAGVGLYWATVSHAAYMRWLSGGVGAGGQPPIARHWWANFQVAPIGTALFLTVGIIGTFTSIAQIVLTERVFRYIKAMSDRSMLQHPALLDIEAAWSPLDRLVTLKLYGLLVFLLTFMALLLILWVPVWEAIVFVTIIGLVLYTTYNNLRFATRTVPGIQIKVREQEQRRLLAAIRARNAPIAKARYFQTLTRRIEAIDLANQLLLVSQSEPTPRNRMLRVLITTLVGSVSLIGLVSSVQSLIPK